MAFYVVGDIQGCYSALSRGLEKLNFNPEKDTLYCAGDLVNRGPESLQTLQLLMSLKDRCITVLGNHDIHLLCLLYGTQLPRSNDTLNDIIASSDASDIAHWLRQKPLMLINDEYRFVLSHAGIYPWWSIAQAQLYANEIQNVLSDESKCIALLQDLYGDTPSYWCNKLSSTQRYRFIINTFTRMRFVSPTGKLQLKEKGFDGKTTKTCLPWYLIGNHYHTQPQCYYKKIFGHWSALGFLNEAEHLCVDTGHIWGNPLTFVKLKKSPNKLSAIKEKRITSVR